MEEKREKVIKIRVSAEEFETLKFNSTKIQLAEWMRETCLNPGQGDLVRDLVQPDPVDPALLRALAGIGNNMNQIAKQLNSKPEFLRQEATELLKSLKSALDEHEKIRQEVMGKNKK